MVGSIMSYPCKQKAKDWLSLIGMLSLCATIFLAPSTYAKTLMSGNTETELGRRIYMEGILPSGKPLHGQHPNSTDVEGSDAACVKCHRRSGLGGLEGNIVAPPITGSFLFASKDNRPVALLDTRSPKDVTRAHAPYTIDTLAKALNKGVNVNSKQLNPLMPRYEMRKADIKALAAYLRQLSAELSPGITEDKLYFATIITPDVDPKRREALIGTMQSGFKQRNASQQVSAGRMRMPIDLIHRRPREWELAVWELKGTPDTWGKQLSDFYRQQPVFALVSGLSETTWDPVDIFCEQQKLPCILPSVARAPQKTGFYSLYFSRGVSLEADALAKYLRDQTDKAPRRVVQVFRDDDIGHRSAQTLSNTLKDSAIKVEDRILGSVEPSELSGLLKDLSEEDAVMSWLKPDDLAKLIKAQAGLIPARLYTSGYLAKEHFENIPQPWRSALRIVYPYELGEKHKKNLAQMNGWLKTWRLPLADESFQSEVFFNLLLLTDLTSQMLDNLYRDYLVERAEDMLSAGTNSSAYPHLSLATGQRFASKGAYIAKFDEKGNLAAESEWIVP